MGAICFCASVRSGETVLTRNKNILEARVRVPSSSGPGVMGALYYIHRKGPASAQTARRAGISHVGQRDTCGSSTAFVQFAGAQSAGIQGSCYPVPVARSSCGFPARAGEFLAQERRKLLTLCLRRLPPGALMAREGAVVQARVSAGAPSGILGGGRTIRIVLRSE